MYFLLSCLFLLIGAVLLTTALVKLLATLNFLKTKTLQDKIFVNKLYLITFIMIIVFLITYLVTLIYLTQIIVMITHFLVVSIFLIGAIFVYVMITLQQEMTSTIIEKNLSVIIALINAVEAKDKHTRGHSENVKNIIELFYETLPLNYKVVIDKNNLLTAALLHDIGKIFVPDSIISKDGELTDEEYEIIKTHAVEGARFLEQIYKNNIPKWVEYHHERADGTGYYNIPSDEVPIESKIIFIADTFSELYSDRVCRQGYPFEETILILKNLRGTQLDKELVDIFCTIEFDRLRLYK